MFIPWTLSVPTCFQEGSNQPDIPTLLKVCVSFGTQATLGKVRVGLGFKTIPGNVRLSHPSSKRSNSGLGFSRKAISCTRAQMHISCALRYPPMGTPLIFWLRTQPCHSNKVFSCRSQWTNKVSVWVSE